MSDIKELVGKTLVKIEGAEKGSDRICFITASGESYIMYHSQNCCESVDVDDICGDIKDLLNSPITMAEEVSSADAKAKGEDESFTWTFYKLATVKGYVTLKWYGTSNGCYSESVDFEKQEAPLREDSI